jgi:membrane protease subunit (stomatin/prohibitin family)
VRAFGTYTLKAIDPARLLSELVGTDGVYEADEIASFLRSIISMAFADILASSGIRVLDLAQNYGELSEVLRKEVVARIDDEYGLEIPQLYIVNVSVPEEVERALDARASMNAIGDMGAYQAYQLAGAMSEAAANPAGGLAGAGVGLGMGLAMTNSMGGMFGGQTGPAGPAPGAAPAAGPPPPVPPTVAWHFAENGQPVGPLSGPQLAQAVAAGRVSRTTLVWCAGMGAWAVAEEVDSLAGLFATLPPPVPGD